jgi:hypothetical protein
MHLYAEIIGKPEALAPIVGPAVVYSPVLASCGIGRELGNGATVVVPGAPGEPLLVSLHANGTDGWFQVDRAGTGLDPATQAFVRLSNDPRMSARSLAKDMRRAMEHLGMAPEPAILDLLFSAPAPPLTRLSVALRAGRVLSGGRGEPVTRYLSGTPSPEHDPLPDRSAVGVLRILIESGRLNWIFNGLSTSVRDHAEEWLAQAQALAAEDEGRDLALVFALVELLSNLVQLPHKSILPPLSAHEDGVAMALRAALGAEGGDDANAQLSSMFRFLGGKYVDSAAHVYEVDNPPPPADPKGRWKWFCAQALRGRDMADELWGRIIDPPQ